jgi:hypothetical protein
MTFPALARAFTSLTVPALSGFLVLAAQACDPGDDAGDPAAIESSGASLSFDNIDGQSTPFMYDSGKQCVVNGVSLHCCPAGMAMTGANLSQNRFKCARVTGGLAGVHGDGLFGTTFTQRSSMHACPFGEVMTGYYHGSAWHGIDTELLLCGKPSPAVMKEHTDGNPATADSTNMHICPEKDLIQKQNIVNPGRFAMTGIHAGQNLFLCGL